MAVGTIVCASLWSKFIRNEQSDSYKQLTRNETHDISASKVKTEKDVMHINAKVVVFFS